jgi:hypothetical protein
MIRAARVPFAAKVGGARWLFGRYLVGGGQFLAVDNGDDLVLGPCVFVVVKAFPEGS